MTSGLRITFAGAACAVLASAGTAAAQDRPATAEQVVEAIDACAAITTPTWIELKDLKGMGWETLRKSNGREQLVRGVYERKGNEAYIVVTRENLREKQCMVMTLLADTASYNALAQEASQTIGMPDRQEGYSYTWMRAGHEVTVNPSGNAKKPKAIFVISVPEGETE